MAKGARDNFLIGLLLLTVFVGLAMWFTAQPDKAVPSVDKGELDLEDWDYRNHGIFGLDGEWEFYPNQLLMPGETSDNKGYIAVPGKWDGWQDRDGRAMSGMGYGTYRLVIQNAPEGQMLAISKNYVRFSDKLYIGGVEGGQSGQPGVSRAQYTPRNVPYVAYFPSQGNEIEILLQTANFDFKNGGIAESLSLGIGKELQVKKSIQVGLELMGAIIPMISAMLIFCLYLWFHRNSLLLLFGVYFFFIAVSVITNGERLFLQFFPDIPFELAFKIKTVSVFITPALLFILSWKLFRRSGVRMLFLSSALFNFAYCVVIVIFPFRVYSYAQDIMYLGITLIYLVLIGYLFLAYLRQQFGILDKRQFQLYFAAVWSHLLLDLNVILSNENLTSALLNNMIFIFFLVTIALLLIHQYVGAYTSMKQLTNQLQIADRMKDEFLLITSHELNTPLNGIMNLSQALLKEPFKKSAEQEMKDKLRFIRNTAYRMSNMVNDIIDAARIKDGKLKVDLKQVDLVACVSVVMEVFGFLAKGKNTQLTHRISPEARYIIADENRLIQVLYNSINYSLRHIQDGIVSIRSRREGHNILIHIESSGSGPQEVNDAIVGEEPEADNSFALGLSIANELTELMGGKFGPNETDGTLEIALPEASESLMEIAAGNEESVHPFAGNVIPEPRQAKEGASKILIASADPVDVEHLYGMLTSEGYEAYCAGTDKEAYAQVTRMDRPDLVLIDVMLPGDNGYELCRRIRQHFTQAEMPVLLIGTRNTSADIEAGISAGGSDFITRPLDPGEIRVRVNTLLSMKRLVKEAAVNEMAFLRSQIKPHFLYNALGTIMSLCYTDGVRAGELLSIFSRYLRIIFHLDNTEETVNLSKEMELIQAYVDIEKARFGDRVRVEFDVDKELLGCQVMPLTIEPLVENAIRHGVSKKLSGGTVRLTIHQEGEFVRVVVEDDGIGMTAEQVRAIMEVGKQEQGVGFRNITRRVAHMTGRTPVVESERGVGTKVTIWLPLAYS
ncbi:hybrid sensor histidine kinase/response regulator [Cohnella herbarum]|uniref:histidine kinase n=1 Tax=Cohnella herbarum TaxID=2728023 RepID=A0A7Z2ZMZ0_9BACL|nr:ATP-binding protein [Cohnella herbarum]QJD84547.1 histidine kinase [Cohnella herbarum]